MSHVAAKFVRAEDGGRDAKPGMKKARPGHKPHLVPEVSTGSTMKPSISLLRSFDEADSFSDASMH